MPQQPPHLIESGPTPQPARRREVPERMRVQSPVRRQPGLGAQAVEGLH